MWIAERRKRLTASVVGGIAKMMHWSPPKSHLFPLNNHIYVSYRKERAKNMHRMGKGYSYLKFKTH